eukprot:gene2125-18170_t
MVYTNEACRIKDENGVLNMGDLQNFRVEEGSSQEQCFLYCVTTPGCTGVEHNYFSQRCEIWTTPITDTAPVPDYDCYIKKPKILITIDFSDLLPAIPIAMALPFSLPSPTLRCF